MRHPDSTNSPVADCGSDRAPIRASLAGETDAFATIYRRYYPKIVARVTARTGDRELAQDVAQDAMTSAVKYLHTFDPDRPFWPWIRQIADHAMGRRLAARGCERGLDTELGGADPVAPGADEVIEQLANATVVHRALGAVSPRQRAALWLRFGEERTSAELAALFQITPNAFDQLIFRAKRALRQELERAGEVLGVGAASAVWGLRVLGSARRARPVVAAKAAAPLGTLPAVSVAVAVGIVAGSLSGSVGYARASATRPAETMHLTDETVRLAGATTAGLDDARAGAYRSTARAQSALAPPTTTTPGTSLRASQGAANAQVAVAPSPAKTGTVEHDRVSVKTPVGTVFVQGNVVNDGSGRLICRVLTCQ
jgi:RNA polymerase sigma-70 factor, ECF subfamily